MPVIAPPTITGLKAPTDTGASAHDGLTRHAAPILAGTAAAGATVVIQRADGSVVGEATLVGTSWTCALPAGEGVTTYKAVAGAQESALFTVAIDRAATAPTAQLAMGGPTDPSGANPGHSGSTQPTLVGTAEPGAIVQVFRGATAAGAVPVGVVTADMTGAWSLQVAADPGVTAFWATAIDRANNKSAKVQVATLDVDPTTPSGIPTLVLTSGAGGSAGPESGLTVAGQSPAAGYVEILVEGVAVGTAQAVWDGEDFVWAFTVPAAALPVASDASLDVSARLVSAHGQRGASATIQVDWDVDGPAAALAIDGLDDAGNILTNTLRPVVSGTAGPDVVRVELRGADGELIGMAPVSAGTWTFQTIYDWATATGETIAVTGFDAAGNASGTASFGLAGDVVAPAMPSVVGFDAPVALPGAEPSDVAGAVIAHLRGEAPGATTIAAYDGQTLLAQATVRLDGSWSLQLPTSIGGGALSVDLIARDAVGNDSDARTYMFTRDLDVPAAPTLVLVGDGRTDDEPLATTGPVAFEGTAGPDVVRVALVRDEVEVAADVPDQGGAFQLAYDGTLIDGEHTFTVVLIDRGGNRTFFDRVIVVDAIAPAAPTFDTTMLSTSPAPVLTGQGEGYAWITLADDGGPIATTQADSTGAWSVAFPGPMPEGPSAFSVVASDWAGNVSAARAGIMTVRTAGSAPVVTAVQGDADPSAAVLTPLTAPELRGTAEAGSQVVVAWGTESVTTSADGTGAWTVVLNLAPGASTPVTVTGTDRFGLVAATSLTVVVGATLPAPTGPLALEGDADWITNNALPAFVGVEAPGATVLLLVDGVLIDQATADATTGAWRIPTTSALAHGDHEAQIVLRDAAGNLSPPSDPFIVEIDLHADVARAAAYTGDSGFSAEDGVTANPGVQLNGRFEAYGEIAVTRGGTTVSTSGGPDGSWTLGVALPTDGLHTLDVLYTDRAGNTATDRFTVRRDASAAGITVAVPALAPGADNGPSSTDGIAWNAGGLTFTGTTLDAATVELLIDDDFGLSTATDFDRQDTDGTLGAATWTLQLPGLAPGVHTIRARGLDLAGNETAFTDAYTFEVVAPLDAPELALGFAVDQDGDGYTAQRFAELVGRVPAAATSVTIQLPGGGSVAADLGAPDAGWRDFELPSAVTLTDGANVMTAIATDAYGQTASVSETFHLDRTAPSQPVVTTLSPAFPAAPASTTDPTPTLAGTVSEAGATITVKRGATVVGTTVSVAGPEGQPATWAVALDVPLNEGSNALTIQAEDRVGLKSAVRSHAVVLDTSAGARPTIAVLAGDNGLSTTDHVLSSETITIGGQLNGAAAIDVEADGVALTSVVLDGLGGWSAAVAADILTATGHSFTVRAAGGGADAVGNQLTVVVDRTVPTLALGGLAPGADAGYQLADRVDGVTTLGAAVVGGTGTPGDGVMVEAVLFGGDTYLLAPAPAVVGPDGTWSFRLRDDAAVEAALVNRSGPVEVRGRVVDAAGNVGATGTLATFTLDSQQPTAVTTITGLKPADDSGTYDGHTTDAQPTFRGTVSAADAKYVAIFSQRGGGILEPIGHTTISDGTWAFEPATPFAQHGEYVIWARALDATGNAATSSASFVYTLDQTAPVAPTLVSVGPMVPGNPWKTTTQTPFLIGNAGEKDLKVSVYEGATLLGTATSLPNGSWSLQLPTRTEGAHTLTVRSTDRAGLTGPDATQVVTVDVTADAIATIGFVGDGGTSGTDGIGGARAIDATTLVGAHGGASSLEVVLSLADNAGVYAIPVEFFGGSSWRPTDSLWVSTPGTHTLTVTAIDADGLRATTARSFVVDDATAVPTIDAYGAVTAGGASLTNDRTPTFTGTAEAGALVRVELAAAATPGTIIAFQEVTAGTDGRWTYTPGSNLAANGNFVATARTVSDVAGNGSATSSPLPFVVDTTAPAAPTFTGITPDNGSSASDYITNTTTIYLTATGESGGIYTAYVDGVMQPTSFTAPYGDTGYSIPVTGLSEGLHTLHVVAQDRASNSGPASVYRSVEVDLTADAVWDLSLATTSDTGFSTTDRQTNADALRITGRSEPYTQVTLTPYLFGVAQTAWAGTATADPAGGWTIDLNHAGLATATGTYIIRASTVDRAGNPSPGATPALTVTLDNAPFVGGSVVATPTLGAGSDSGASATDGLTNVTRPTLTGLSGTATGYVNIYGSLNGGAEQLLGSIDAGSALAAWSFTPSTALAEGTWAIVAAQADAAGNPTTATRSAPFTFKVDTTAPVLSYAFDFVQGSVLGSTERTFDIAGSFSGEPYGAEVTITRTKTGTPTVLIGFPVHTAGTWGGELPQLPASDGTYNYAFVARDAAGNASTGSATTVLDTIAPTAPTVTTFQNSTNDGLYAISGTAEPFADIRVVRSASTIGATSADANGNWSFRNTVASRLPTGPNMISAHAIDEAFNSSPVGNFVSVSVSNPFLNFSALTEERTVRLTTWSGSMAFAGTNAPANATVTILLDGVAYATPSANVSGAFTSTITTAIAADANANTVVATHQAPGRSDTTITIVVDDAIAAGDRWMQVRPGDNLALDQASFTPQFRSATPDANVGIRLVQVPSSFVGYLYLDTDGDNTWDFTEPKYVDNDVLTLANIIAGKVKFAYPFHNGSNPFFTFQVTDGASQVSRLETFTFKRAGSLYELGDEPAAAAELPADIDWCAIAIDLDAFGGDAFQGPGAQPVAAEALFGADAQAGELDLEALVGPAIVLGERIEEVYGPQPTDMVTDGDALRRMLEQQQLLASLGAV